MRVVFRADASVTMGSGHVMRCLTLATTLRERGAQVTFVCREYDGDLCDFISDSGFDTKRLPGSRMRGAFSGDPGHGSWLGPSWSEDAEQTHAALLSLSSEPDWLVVDHYALDHRWESALRSAVRRILVIDDLADRRHDCELLLDQNFESPLHGLYPALLPHGAVLLTGPRYALVRPEFARQRPAALSRRNGELSRLLVFMGGSDPENETTKVLQGLRMLGTVDLRIDVVIGSSNPYRDGIAAMCIDFPRIELHIQTERMADLMTSADCAIMASGSTSWERCTVALPALVTIIGANQRPVAVALARSGAHRLLGESVELTPTHYAEALADLTATALRAMAKAASAICDGLGTSRVATLLERRLLAATS
jgi:UDP-2,4-diacetamido-2,4,6-trideoxy-beta-L-altropyranose hydrolase